MMPRQITCIVCPNGCELSIQSKRGVFVIADVSGALCEKGAAWVEQELTSPMRTIATNMLVREGDMELVSVRTDCPIPRDKIFAVMAQIKIHTAQAPIAIGDILIDQPAGTDCRIIATRDIKPKDRPGFLTVARGRL